MLTLMWQTVLLFMATILSAPTYIANMGAPSTSEKAWLMFPIKIQHATHCDIVKVGTVSIANVYRPPSEPWSSDKIVTYSSSSSCLRG